jgi:integrase/recombinase XerD
LRDVRGRRQNTLDSYNQVLRFWLEHCTRKHIEPLRPTLEELESFVARVRKNGHKGAASSRRTDVATLRGWYKWMHERGRLQTNPTRDLQGPSSPRSEPRPFEDDDWATLWNSDLQPRQRVMLGFGYYAGLRREEIGSLLTEQITPSRIVRLMRKGGHEHTLPWRDMAEVIYVKLPHLLPDMNVLVGAVEHVRNNHPRVIPWEQPKELYRHLSKLCSRLEIAQYTPHQLRHSTATNLLRAGVKPHVVMRLMNHSSFDITMGYVRAGAGDLREWLDTMEDPIARQEMA